MTINPKNPINDNIRNKTTCALTVLDFLLNKKTVSEKIIKQAILDLKQLIKDTENI